MTNVPGDTTTKRKTTASKVTLEKRLKIEHTQWDALCAST
jgi:hypothetical protein